jgi:hypothetical protein
LVKWFSFKWQADIFFYHIASHSIALHCTTSTYDYWHMVHNKSQNRFVFSKQKNKHKHKPPFVACACTQSLKCAHNQLFKKFFIAQLPNGAFD